MLLDLDSPLSGWMGSFFAQLLIPALHDFTSETKMNSLQAVGYGKI